jgi:hypothetical protein
MHSEFDTLGISSGLLPWILGHALTILGALTILAIVIQALKDFFAQ